MGTPTTDIRYLISDPGAGNHQTNPFEDAQPLGVQRPDAALLVFRSLDIDAQKTEKAAVGAPHSKILSLLRRFV